MYVARGLQLNIRANIHKLRRNVNFLHVGSFVVVLIADLTSCPGAKPLRWLGHIHSDVCRLSSSLYGTKGISIFIPRCVIVWLVFHGEKDKDRE